jgi:uncharacterized OB-fold protein
MTMGVMPEGWALPAVDDANREWFTSGAVTVQRCQQCGTRQHPPEELCHHCGALDLGHEVLAPTGTVHSYTVAHYPVNRALADAVPYAVVLVSLDDAPELRVVGNVVDVAPDAISIGMRVVATWEERSIDDGTVIQLPLWRAADEPTNTRRTSDDGH